MLTTRRSLSGKRSRPDPATASFVDVTVVVTWEGGQVTRHTIRDLPDLSGEQLDEVLSKDLASYLDADELPTSPAGLGDGLGVGRSRVRP